MLVCIHAEILDVSNHVYGLRVLLIFFLLSFLFFLMLTAS